AGSVAGGPEGPGEEVAIRVVKAQGEGGVRRGRGLPSREGHGGGDPFTCHCRRPENGPRCNNRLVARRELCLSSRRRPPSPIGPGDWPGGPGGARAGSRGC